MAQKSNPKNKKWIPIILDNSINSQKEHDKNPKNIVITIS